LENEVIPCFYDRKNGDIPNCWIEKMKSSMKMVMESFCSLRMVSDYKRQFYVPAAKRWDLLMAQEAEEARKTATQIQRLRALWKDIHIKPPVRETPEPYHVGDRLRVTSEVSLAGLDPNEVDVELYYGNLKSLEELSVSHVELMSVSKDLGNGYYLYSCTLDCDVSGRFGFTVRVSPHGDGRLKSTPRLLAWA
jgi:starch phosphorylase